MVMIESNHSLEYEDTEKQTLLRYSDILQTLNHVLSFYEDTRSVKVLMDARHRFADRLLGASKGQVLAIIGSGYPLYMLNGPFEPVSSILEYVSDVKASLMACDLSVEWPCIDCHSRSAFTGISRSCPACEFKLHPFRLYTALPDLDFYIVTKDANAFSRVADICFSLGYGSAEKNMVSSILGFPTTLNVDLFLCTQEQFLAGIEAVSICGPLWPGVVMPVTFLHRVLVSGDIHIGQDLVFSLTSFGQIEPSFSDGLNITVKRWISERGCKLLVQELRNTDKSQVRAVRIGQLLRQHSFLELNLLRRLRKMLETGLLQA